MNTLLLWLSGALLVSGAAFAQLALPGAATEDSGAEKPAVRKPHVRHAAPASGRIAASPDSILDKTLRLNGRNGELRLTRGEGAALRIVKLSLPGEVISRPSQACRIDIVAETPIEAHANGDPEGSLRFAAEIPACPLSFDVVDGAVLAPPQTNACVFSAADCQASPSGLWGPPAAELDAKPIAKARGEADRSIQDSLRNLEERDAAAAAALSREESDFAAQRDDVCHDYEGETRHGFCASRLAQLRAALLAKRVSEAGHEREPASVRPKRKRKST